MVDISAIGAALSSLKAAKDIAEAMVGVRDAAAFQGKLIEFQSKIIDANNAAFAAQDERSALLEEIRTLKEQVAQFKAWDAEKQKYVLAPIGPGAVAFVLKPQTKGTQTPHWLCATCFEKGNKGYLQKFGSLGNDHVYQCSACSVKIMVPWSLNPTKG
jgi:hypothetical protein